MMLGIFVWLAAALLCYVFMRRSLYNLFDPVAVNNISIPFSAALVAVLCSSGLILWQTFYLFGFVLLAYLLGVCFVGQFSARGLFAKQVNAMLETINGRELMAILVMTLLVTMVVAVLGIAGGAQGDARQGFMKAFRPLVTMQNGLATISLVLLLSPRLTPRRSIIFLLTLTVLSIPFSGKGVLIPILYWVGLRLFARNRRITLRALVMVSSLVIAGALSMALIAYGTTDARAALLLVMNRFWMSGDAYIYAYQAQGLEAVRGNYPVTFFAYILHPFTSLVGVRGYDKPLGSMLASAVMHDDLLTGPNPQLPILMDFFFSGNAVATGAAAFLIGMIAMGFRSIGTLLATGCRSRYLRLGLLTTAIFGPVSGFIDVSQMFIAVIGIAAATLLLVSMDLVLNGRRRLGEMAAIRLSATQ